MTTVVTVATVAMGGCQKLLFKTSSHFWYSSLATSPPMCHLLLTHAMVAKHFAYRPLGCDLDYASDDL